MGIDSTVLQFLAYIGKEHGFGKVLTLGRQNNHIRWVNPSTGEIPGYCEQIIEYLFGATEVHSVDASPYEGASLIHDLNEPWSCEPFSSDYFDAILDLGTLEHVFNVHQGLETIARSTKSGGTIVHVLCHNDQSGHGFWQFSPELFFSWYTQENGFDNLEVFIAPVRQSSFWVKCVPPVKGERCELSGRRVPCSYVLVKVTKVDEVLMRKCQQSDYVTAWSNHSELDASRLDMKMAVNPSSAQSAKTSIGKNLPLVLRKLKKILRLIVPPRTSPTPWYCHEFLKLIPLNEIVPHEYL